MPKADLLWLCPDHRFDGERLLAAQALGLRDGLILNFAAMPLELRRIGPGHPSVS